MNDTQLLNRLGRANAYGDNAPLPDAIWTHDLALREIDRRIGMQTQEKTTPVVAPEPRRRGWLVAAAAFGVVLLVGVIGVYACSFLPFFNSSRYRVPLVPLLAILAAVGTIT